MLSTNENPLYIMQQKMEHLMKENEELKKHHNTNPNNDISFKINERGAIEIIGLAKYRHSFFADQALRLLEKEAALRAFIETNKKNLSWKSVKK